jgi:C1A family cysteine protease
MPSIYDQGQIGSCTSNAAARLVQFDRRLAKETPDWVPSRLLMYYDVRAAEGSIAPDSGAELRDVMKTLAYYGVCPESEWPYDDTPADPTTGLFPAGCPAVTHPPRNVYADARKHVPITYSRVQQTLPQLKGCIYQGFPFMFGFIVFSSMFDANDNPVTDLPMPAANDDQEGGHAVVGAGYDDSHVNADGSAGAFLIANSWGDQVQDGGYFWMPYRYITDASLCSDFWTMRRISSIV